GHGEQRQAEHFELRLLEADGPLLAVPDDLAGADPPGSRLVRIVSARLAGGIGAVGEGGDVAALALGALGGEPGAVDRLDLERPHETGAEIVGDVDLGGADDGAGALDDLDIAAGDQ